MAQRTECTILLSVKIVSSLCPKRNPDPTGLINTLRKLLGIGMQKEKAKDGSAESSKCAEIN